MLRVALGLTKNRQDAEDLVQEALVRAFRAIVVRPLSGLDLAVLQRN